MSEEIKQSIAEYLASHRYLALATISADDKPIVHSMGYGSDEAVVYCATFKGTRKVANIERNPSVAFVVSEDYDDWGRIQGVQIQGKAVFLQDKEDIDRAVGCIAKNFPRFADMGPNPDVVFMRVEPEEGVFIDYTKGFSHKDMVTY